MVRLLSLPAALLGLKFVTAEVRESIIVIVTEDTAILMPTGAMTAIVMVLSGEEISIPSLVLTVLILFLSSYDSDKPQDMTVF